VTPPYEYRVRRARRRRRATSSAYAAVKSWPRRGGEHNQIDDNRQWLKSARQSRGVAGGNQAIAARVAVAASITHHLVTGERRDKQASSRIMLAARRRGLLRRIAARRGRVK